MPTLFFRLLLISHLALSLWALTDILELLLHQPSWFRISTPLFTPAMLLCQLFRVAPRRQDGVLET